MFNKTLIVSVILHVMFVFHPCPASARVKIIFDTDFGGDAVVPLSAPGDGQWVALAQKGN